MRWLLLVMLSAFAGCAVKPPTPLSDGPVLMFVGKKVFFFDDKKLLLDSNMKSIELIGGMGLFSVRTDRCGTLDFIEASPIAMCKNCFEIKSEDCELKDMPSSKKLSWTIEGQAI